MGGFKVDTDAVRGLGNSVSQICADLKDATSPVELSDAAAGSRDVGQALRDFASHWKAEQDKLLTNLEGLAKSIKDAAESYDRSDSSIAAATEGTSA